MTVAPGLWLRIAGLAWAGAPAVPPPTLDPDVPPPILDVPDRNDALLGPRLGPDPQPQPSPTPHTDDADPPGTDESGGSIEFAVPPPEDDPEDEGSAPAPPATDASQWPDPGRAPSDGLGSIGAAAILLPTAAFATWGLVGPGPVTGDGGQISIIVAGAGLGAIGLGLVGLGAYRLHKLRRWEIGYRVRATAQGSGMLSIGAISLNFGAVAVLSGALALTNDVPDSLGVGLLIGGLITAGAIAPPLLVFGRQRRQRYLATDGWVRPPLPPIPERADAAGGLYPSISVVRGGLTLGLRARF